MEKTLGNSDHVKSLDGLRGLAIILVLLAHLVREKFLIEHFPIIGPIITKLSLLGLTGVSLFFVLSGYLITNILLNAKNKKNYFRNFYIRRILRIFPLYYISLLIVFFILPLIINFSAESTYLKSNQIWLWSYLSNFPPVAGIWNLSKQFALGHFWSLSVEEHFYLIWPLIVYKVKLKNLKLISKLIIALSLISGVLSLLFMNEYIFFKYISWTTITFSGGLAAGALIAIHKHENGSLLGLERISKYLILIFGILFIIVGFIPRRFNPELLLQINHEISWFLYSGLIIYTLNLRNNDLVNKLLINKILLIFGKLSYGIYVFHGLLMPTFDKYINVEKMALFFDSYLLALISFYVISIGIVLFLSWISWNLIEKRFLLLKSYFN